MKKKKHSYFQLSKLNGRLFDNNEIIITTFKKFISL